MAGPQPGDGLGARVHEQMEWRATAPGDRAVERWWPGAADDRVSEPPSATVDVKHRYDRASCEPVGALAACTPAKPIRPVGKGDPVDRSSQL
jgi:hypothetical protein